MYVKSQRHDASVLMREIIEACYVDSNKIKPEMMELVKYDFKYNEQGSKQISARYIMMQSFRARVCVCVPANSLYHRKLDMKLTPCYH